MLATMPEFSREGCLVSISCESTEVKILYHEELEERDGSEEEERNNKMTWEFATCYRTCQRVSFSSVRSTALRVRVWQWPALLATMSRVINFSSRALSAHGEAWPTQNAYRHMIGLDGNSLRFALAFLAVALALGRTSFVAAQSAAPSSVDYQLLVDDHSLSQTVNVTRVLGKVAKANDGEPIFRAGWFYGTVLHDEQRFKLWYRKPEAQGYGYAESENGVDFTIKANVTGINFAGDYTLAVEIDSHEPDAAHRYKAAYDAPGMAAGIAHSADGIRWQPYNQGQPVTSRAADTYNQILWDPLAKTYRLFTRTDFGTAGGATEIRGTRSMTNPDLKRMPKDFTLVREWFFDREGRSEARRRQIYAVTCWIYRDLYFALLSVYEYPGDLSEGTSTDHRTRHERDVMNFYLATSRDGDHWDFQWVYAGQPIIPRGPAGAFDMDIILPASTIVTRGDEHWLYYSGANERHGTDTNRLDRQHAIGLAKLPRDRFVGLAADHETGTIVTKPWKLSDPKISLNIDARAGEVTVEVLDAQGTIIPGYTVENMVVATGVDALDFQPRWQQHADLSKLLGQTIQLRIRMRNAILYAYRAK